MPTPMQIGNANESDESDERDSPFGWLTPTKPEATKIDAPLSSHFSCSRCSPLDRR